MHKVVLVRHGESTWNQENRFTGWTDVDLSPKGLTEAKEAGGLLKKEGFEFDQVYTSVLRRAIRTAWIIQDELDLLWLPVQRSWRLNERHYGSLQGLNKIEMTEKFGEAQVKIWRRSYDTPPPALEATDSRYPGFERKYADIPKNEVPLTESLKDTVARVVPYWREVLAPAILSGKRVLVVAHGNSLRALMKYLDKISDSAIVEMNVPTGIPLIYELDSNLKPVKNYYLGDAEKVAAAQAAVASQTKKKT